MLITLFITRGVPYVPSFDSDMKLMLNLNIPSGKTVLDLGCGDGKVLRFFVKNYNCSKCVGYELNHFAVHFGRLINKLKGIKNIDLYHKNFYKANFEGIDYVFVYLMPETLEKIEDWLFDAISPQTIIISNTFQFKKHEPFEVIKNSKGYSKIHMYKK